MIVIVNRFLLLLLIIIHHIFPPYLIDVGKTQLLLKYMDDFSPSTMKRIGLDIKIKNIILDNKRIKLQIWDTAGQERFRTITTSYFRGAQGVLLVYDVSNRHSFHSVQNWLKQNLQVIEYLHFIDFII